MRIITGDECGLLKEIIPELCRPSPTDPTGRPTSSPSWQQSLRKRPRPSATSIQAQASSHGDFDGAVQRLQHGEGVQNREKGIVSLAFVPRLGVNDKDTDANESPDFVALRIDGSLERWSVSIPGRSGLRNDEGNVTPGRYNPVTSMQDVFDGKERATAVTEGKGWYCNPPVQPIGMVSNWKSVGSDNTLLAVCDSLGNVSLVDATMNGGTLARYNAFLDDSETKSIKDSVVLTYTKGRFSNNHIAAVIGMDSGGRRLAVGGRERGVRILDLETGKMLWKAKNLPPDPQTLLQQPMWTTALQFIHSPSNPINSNTHSDLLATGTAYKQVQIFDIRSSSDASSTSSASRRPVLHTPEHLLTHRITSLVQIHDPNLLVVADSVGDCHILDMRKLHSGKQLDYRKQKRLHSQQEIGLGRLVGPGGSIRQLALHPTLPMLACVGLDRKLWTWDLDSRRMVDCVYLRQRLNCLLFFGDETWGGNDVEEQRDDGVGTEVLHEGTNDDEVEDYVDSEEDDHLGEGMSDDINDDNASVESSSSDDA